MHSRTSTTLGDRRDAALRELLRDVVALSAIPAVWVERAVTMRESGTEAVAAGLADALVGLLELDFAFVRLRDPLDAGAVDMSRGTAWKRFPEWLDAQRDPASGSVRRHIVPDVGDGPEPFRGVAIPIGLHGEAGVLAAASGRADFPTATDQLLLSLAANQAAAAFQSARLVQERRRAELELREAQTALEATVTERTVELRRTEAYLVEAQRLTHTGSFAIDIATRAVTHSSDENSRLYGFDPADGLPPAEAFLERIHPEDRAACVAAFERGIVEGTTIELEYRIVLAAGAMRRHRATAHPIFDASGELHELIGTIVDVTDRRRAEAEMERLVAQQAALRRVATLVAKEVPPEDVFAKVTEELANVLGDVDCSLFRDEGDGVATVVAVCGRNLSAGVRVGSRRPVDGTGVIASVFREGRPARIGDYSAASGTLAEKGRDRLGIRSAVGCPVVVRGRIWGALGAARYQPDALPPETEARITEFGELVATAIANAHARTEVERLADEQAALRRVATLVAKGAHPPAVFDAVAAEMERLLKADHVALIRFERGGGITTVATRGPDIETERLAALVRRTERPARLDDSRASPDGDVSVAIGAPIVVEGRLWGVVTAGWTGENAPPRHTAPRMARFAELLDTAIANADSRDQLRASRVRLLTAADEARRRVVRDLHDGAQQRLVHAIVTLKLARRELGDTDAGALVSEALEQAEEGNRELRELAHGILPGALANGGLRSALDTLVKRVDLRVDVDVPADRFPPEIEASAYFIVAEALTNVVKHARADRAEVEIAVEDRRLQVEIRDDGIGGADPEGHGLVGLVDRATALGGRLRVQSPAGAGTLVTATLPF
jgi:signal transduction histidine kinase/PAS domain-containing protein